MGIKKKGRFQNEKKVPKRRLSSALKITFEHKNQIIVAELKDLEIVRYWIYNAEFNQRRIATTEDDTWRMIVTRIIKRYQK